MSEWIIRKMGSNAPSLTGEAGGGGAEETLCCTYASLLSTRVFAAVSNHFSDVRQTMKLGSAKINSTLSSSFLRD